MFVHSFIVSGIQIVVVLWVTSQSNGEYNICIILYYGWQVKLTVSIISILQPDVTNKTLTDLLRYMS